EVERDAGARDEAGDAAGVAAVPGGGEAGDGALEAGLLRMGEERGPEDEGQGDDGGPRDHAGALASPAISEEIRSITATGSGAAATERPMTRKSAPARAASAGVAVRTWSAAASPAGRMPGVTTRKSGPCLRLMVSTSTAEATTPSRPASAARAASRATSSRRERSSLPQASSRSAAAKEVNTVTPTRSGPSCPAASRAAR